MVFNFYLDPEVIGVAAASPPYGMQALCDVLRGFLDNGLLFDFEDERCRQAIGRAVNSLPNGFDRKRAAALFSALVKRNRILCIMEPDWLSTTSDIDQALDLAPKYSIQLVLTEQTPTTTIPAGVECVTLAEYPTSVSGTERHAAATTGRTYSGGEMSDAAFLDSNFANAFRHARRIEICDRLVGEKFADNFEHTVRQFFRFLEARLHDPGACEVAIHCGASNRNHHFCHMLASFRGQRTASLRITTNFYSNPTEKPPLPHERYIWTDQFAFLVGRGMDFLERASGTNRDVSIDLKDESEVAQNVAAYDAMRVGSNAV